MNKKYVKGLKAFEQLLELSKSSSHDLFGVPGPMLILMALKLTRKNDPEDGWVALGTIIAKVGMLNEYYNIVDYCKYNFEEADEKTLKVAITTEIKVTGDFFLPRRDDENESNDSKG